MANISSRQQALDVLRRNFSNAQNAGRISRKAVFDPKLVKEILTRHQPKNGMASQCQLVYYTTSGEENRRVRRSHCYPALVTN